MSRCIFDSPIGRLYIEEDSVGICAVRMADDGECTDGMQSGSLLLEARAQLEAYFRGEGCVFDLPLSLGGTTFERAVWQQLQSIPHGQTRTYGQIAAALGAPGAARAVGRACGANPVLVFVPCHRVVGAGGKLTGFAAGMDAKRHLLALEGHRVTGDRIGQSMIE